MKWFLVLGLFFSSAVHFAQSVNKLTKKATEAKAYCKKNKLNTDLCFLVDFSIHSGKKRFFIYDLKANVIIDSGLVCHGLGQNSTQQQAVYSNVVGSNCSSLGKYKIGKRAYSNWGINVHYKMHGLESSNSRAFQRQIVLHAYEYVPETEIYPSHLTLGWSQGCPVVANGLMTKIDKLLTKAKLPTLVWIFE
ncbi:MAG: murein L,D-transpeptidase catalytic domain family protein [Bacteroidota bacterium]